MKVRLFACMAIGAAALTASFTASAATIEGSSSSSSMLVPSLFVSLSGKSVEAIFTPRQRLLPGCVGVNSASI